MAEAPVAEPVAAGEQQEVVIGECAGRVVGAGVAVRGRGARGKRGGNKKKMRVRRPAAAAGVGPEQARVLFFFSVF
jgi:hypothetical protein